MADPNQLAWNALQVMHSAVGMSQRTLEAANITSTQRLISRAHDRRRMANRTRDAIDDIDYYIENFSSPFTLNHHVQRRQVLMSDWNDQNARALDAENEVHMALATVPDHLRRRLLEPIWPSLPQPISIHEVIQELAEQRRQLIYTLSQNNTQMSDRRLRYIRRLRRDRSDVAQMARYRLS